MAFVTLKHHGFPSSFPPNSPSPNSCRLAMIATLLILRPVHLPHTTHIQSDVTSRLRAGPRLLFPFILASPRYPYRSTKKSTNTNISAPVPCLTCRQHSQLPHAPNPNTSHRAVCPMSRRHTPFLNHDCHLSIRNWRTQTPDPRDARQTRPEGDSRIYPHPARRRVLV